MDTSLDERGTSKRPTGPSGSRVRFSIARWSAWSPDAAAPRKRPEIPEVPMLLRRRASFADCLALRVAFDCAGALGPMPVVFCSRYGEVHRSVEMLEALSKNEPFSPMTFGLSVHNAAAALYSIARGDRSATSAVAAGRDSLPEGVLEACGVLAAGAPRVLLVAYDDGLPEAFGRFADDGDRPAALGLLLEPAGKDAYSLELGRCETPETPPTEPQVASVARFLKESGRTLELSHGARRWIWSRDD
jgi:hypothetical protein